MASLPQTSEMDREELLSAMHSETAKIAKGGYDKLSRLRNAGVILCIELGCQIDQLTDNEAVGDKGLEITKLAAYLGMDNTNRLYEWRNTAAVFCKETDKDTGKISYNKDFITDQMLTPMGNGKLLTFEHFKFLGRVSTDKKRKSLLKQVRKNSWSANSLASEIKGSVADLTTSRSGGRKPLIPGSVFQCVQKAFTQAQKLDNYLIAVEDGVTEKFEEVSTDKVDEGFINKIDNAIEMLGKLQETAQRNVDILTDGREHMLGVIENTVIHVTKGSGNFKEEEADDECVTGTQMAAKIREVAFPKKKKKSSDKQLRPSKSKK